MFQKKSISDRIKAVLAFAFVLLVVGGNTAFASVQSAQIFIPAAGYPAPIPATRTGKYKYVTFKCEKAWREKTGSWLSNVQVRVLTGNIPNGDYVTIKAKTSEPMTVLKLTAGNIDYNHNVTFQVKNMTPEYTAWANVLYDPK